MIVNPAMEPNISVDASLIGGLSAWVTWRSTIYRLGFAKLHRLVNDVRRKGRRSHTKQDGLRGDSASSPAVDIAAITVDER
jgi:hypothetical protein